MRTIKQTAQFKRDLKREARSVYRALLQEEFVDLIAVLANDQPLNERYRDHALSGN